MRIEEFDFNIEVLEAVLWQYDNSPNLKDLMIQKEAWLQLFYNGFWSRWIIDVFDLRTANLFGLAVWSYILALPLYVPVSPDAPGKPIFGFNQLLSTGPNVLLNSYLNFGNSNFSARNAVVSLTIEEQRLLLRMRYYQLTTNGTIDRINFMLNELFTESGGVPYSGSAWAEDNLDMTMTYVFNFQLPPNMQQIFEDRTLNILGCPAGVEQIITVNP